MDDVTLIHGDCLRGMPAIPSGSFDAVITDPPFGVRPDEWDDMDPREFARFSMAWLSQARRIAPELVVFCNQDSPIIPLCEMLYRRVRRMIWYKPKGSQYSGGRECGLWYCFEMILHCHDRKSWSVVRPKDLDVATMIRKARDSAGLSRSAVDIAVRGKKTGLCFRWEEGACLPTPDQLVTLSSILDLGDEFDEAMSRATASRDGVMAVARERASEYAARGIDVFEYRTVTQGIHPCEKPVGLLSEILTGIGADYRKILDPFAGSASTLVACLALEREAVGFEKDDHFFDSARRRLDAERSRTALFDAIPNPSLGADPARPPLPGQLSFLDGGGT